MFIAFTVHEFSHAAIATLFGDPTPRDAGRLTLNPLKHLDIFGTLMLLVAGFGWAKPVPINPYAINQKNKAGVMLVSLAGPASNFLLACFAAIPLRFNWIPLIKGASDIFPSWGEFVLEFVFINLALFLFNLIPLPPLDGEKIVAFFLPEHWVEKLEKIRPYSSYILLFVVFILPRIGFDVMDIILNQPLISLTRFLIGL
ncbi:site-2 protease family protein [Chloroflexota bacterium]|nr:site-2 protease family protein [Chloroflexota bacterium]